jgi:hypothetical protein
LQLFGPLNGGVLAPLLVKIALSDASMSGKAVLRAILALSCLHLRLEDDASAYRASSVSLVSVSLKGATDPIVAFQSISASMLLCMFELQLFLQQHLPQ